MKDMVADSTENSRKDWRANVRQSLNSGRVALSGQSLNLRHPLALPVIAAGCAGVLAAVAIIILPDWRLEKIAWELYLDRISAGATPPLGLKARFLMAAGAGSIAATLTGGLAYILRGKTMGMAFSKLRFWDRKNTEAAPEIESSAPVRRRDFHPDAPAPRPVNAHAELGEPLPPLAGIGTPVSASVLATKGDARTAAALPQADTHDWSNPDDVLLLGDALAVTGDETLVAQNIVNGPSAPAASAAVEFPSWAYEEGQRMAREDAEYADNAVERARRVYPPTTPDDIDLAPMDLANPFVQPHSAQPPLDLSLDVQASAAVAFESAEFFTSDDNKEEFSVNQMADFGADGLLYDDVYSAAELDGADMQFTSSTSSDAYGSENFAPAEFANASIEAMIDRLERALAHRVTSVAGPLDVRNGVSAPHSDEALDAALSTLARMNSRAYG
jgi:hypothetical protein